MPTDNLFPLLMLFLLTLFAAGVAFDLEGDQRRREHTVRRETSAPR
jgi:uncharacterized membrane protein